MEVMTNRGDASGMDEYAQVYEELKQARADDQQLLNSYYETGDEAKLQKSLERLIFERINKKKYRNSVSVNSDLYGRFEKSWSQWILAIVPDAAGDSKFTSRSKGHYGRRLKTKELRRQLNEMGVSGYGICELGKIKWSDQGGIEKRLGASAVEWPDCPDEVVHICRSNDIGKGAARYCLNGSHKPIDKVLNKILKEGSAVMLRGRRCQEASKRDEDIVLKKYRYPWTEVYSDVLIYKEDPESDKDIIGGIHLSCADDKTKDYRHKISLNPDSHEADSGNRSGFFEESHQDHSNELESDNSSKSAQEFDDNESGDSV